MIRWITLVALCALAGCSEEKPPDSGKADAYAVRLSVTPASGAPLQRLSLPAEALAALRSADRSDVRLFDGAGTALPLAAAGPSGARADYRPMRLEALPILGTDGAARSNAVLSIEQSGGTRVVRMIEAAKPDGGSATIGVLLDARAIADPAHSLRLEGHWPAYQPVAFAVDASDDLRNWAGLGGRTLYRKSADPSGATGTEDIALGDADLRGRWLRVSWSSPSKLLGPVSIGGATLTLARATESDRPAIATADPTRLGAYELRLGFDHAIAPSGVRIRPAGGEMLIRVGIAGRNAPDQPWTPVGAGMVRAVAAGTAPETIALQGEADDSYRIEADHRTAGFAVPPRIELLFAPMQLVALFDGKPPYTLAAGAGAAENRYLELRDLVSNDRPGAVAGLAQATVAASPASRLATVETGDRFDRRKALLWSLLLLGVAVLGLMVWRLWKAK